MQDGLGEGNHRLVGNLAEVLDFQPHLPGHVRRQCPALRILHTASGEAVLPLRATDARETRAQAIEQAGPVAGGQLQVAGQGHGVHSGHGKERQECHR